MKSSAIAATQTPRAMRVAAILLAFMPVAGGAEEAPNNGEDFTRPPAQFDGRYQYQARSDGSDRHSFILRRNQPTPLVDGWELSTRFDLPLVLSDKAGIENGSGDMAFGLGDLLVQAALIHTATDRFAWGGGARFLFPTASEDELGSGQYRLLPLLGARFKLPEISPGSFLQFLGRYDFDLGGDGGRGHVSQIQFSPTLSLALPDRWFVTFFPSQDIVFNLTNHRWFVPANVSIGRHLGERSVVSLEASVPVIKEFTLYDFKLEARLSFSF